MKKHLIPLIKLLLLLAFISRIDFVFGQNTSMATEQVEQAILEASATKVLAEVETC